MPRRSVVLVVALAAVLAGCPGLAGSDSTPTQTPSEHPWRGETVVVALDADGESDRYEPLLEEALGYWEQNGGRYAFPVSFELRPNASDPDINVQVVDEIYECGNEPHTAGCTLQATDPGAMPDTVEFEIRQNLSEGTSVEVMKHELGHILGLDHGDEPRGLMDAQLSGSVRDRPDATERAVPWNRTTLRVAVDAGNTSGDRAAVDAQTDQALAFYGDGANGTVLSNVSFERVERDADIRITVAGADACPDGRPVCVSLDGTDVDGDDAFERYTHLQITLADPDTDAVGWYVARGLAPGFGLADDDLPPELTDATARERRGEWWE